MRAICHDHHSVARVISHIGLVLGTASITLLACSENGLAPLSSANSPTSLSVAAVRLNAVRLTWSRVDDNDVIGYAIERRSNLSGPFVKIVDQIPQSGLDSLTWLDTNVEPDTYYGYRVYAVTRYGDRSIASVVGGSKTPPMPGVEVSTTSLLPSADAADSDGYTLTITGPDTVHTTIGVSQRSRINPLRPGHYNVALTGVASRCTLDGAATQSVDVTDTTAMTVVPVAFHVTCRDPSRGDIHVTLVATGDDIDPEYTLSVVGEADDSRLPDAARLFAQDKSLALANPSAAFDNLRPGTYEVTIKDLASNCALQGAAKRTARVTALGTATLAYVVACTDTTPAPPTRTFTWRNKWSVATAAPGEHVTLTVELDLSSRVGQKVQGVQADIAYDRTVLQYDSENVAQLLNLTVNASTPGNISFLAATSSPKVGVVTLVTFDFTVIGVAGAKTTTVTTNLKAGSPTPFQTDVSVQEGKFTVGTVVNGGGGGGGGGGGTTNQLPTAEANGPYSGTTATAVSFSAAGSTDGDGTVVGYAWNFGDNATGSGANASHTYATAGTYTVTLTVTDNVGATATDHATVTIAMPPPSNTLPVAEANGPYAATAGVARTLSANGSIDPDGTIASYSWAFGDGQTGTGATPSVTYAAAGTYTVTLTVTDNKGATATKQTTVTVSAPVNTKPLLWTATFGAVNPLTNMVTLTISYDLQTDIIETPGAEALASFIVDSLKWNPAVLQFSSINLGPGIVGSSRQGKVSNGNLSLHGTVSSANAHGVVTVATIRFTLIGSSGAAAATSTFLGPLQGDASTNNFPYNTKTTVIEGQMTLP